MIPLYIKLVATLTLMVGLLQAQTQAETMHADPLLSCPSSYQAPLYDTPSGKLDASFYDAAKPPAPFTYSTTTAPAPLIAAHVIGSASHSVCKDSAGNKYIVPISSQAYNSLATSTGIFQMATTSSLTTFLSP